MDTSTYFYAAYSLFWLLPAIFIIRFSSQLKTMDEKISNLQQRLDK